ncbi:MAG: hypothetical protein WCH39_29525, partial [Schlesneria sp.]
MSENREAGSDRIEDLLERQFHAWKNGKPLFIEELMADQSPTFSENELMQLVYSEFTFRTEHGQTGTFEEYLNRFPDFSGPLKRLFDILEFLAEDEAGQSRSDNTSTKSPPGTSGQVDDMAGDHDSVRVLSDTLTNQVIPRAVADY